MKEEAKIQPNETENQNDNFCRFDAVVIRQTWARRNNGK